MRDHDFQTIGWNWYVCLDCGLDSWAATDTGPCRKRPTLACATQSNFYLQGTCRQLFDTPRDASAHWISTHQPTVNADLDAAVARYQAAHPPYHGI